MGLLEGRGRGRPCGLRPREEGKHLNSHRAENPAHAMNGGLLRRFREEFLSRPIVSNPLRRNSKSRRRTPRTASNIGSSVAFHPELVLETHAEVRLGTFLKPFHLTGLASAVHQLTAVGFTTQESLRALDYDQCKLMDFKADDAERILLATWLESNGMHHYGEGLVASGCVSPLHLLNMSDATFVRAGIRAIGHRRQLFRYLREDESLHVRLDQLREIFDKEDRERRQLDAQEGWGGSSASSLTPAQIYAVTGAGRRGAVSGGGGGGGGGGGVVVGGGGGSLSGGSLSGGGSGGKSTGSSGGGSHMTGAPPSESSSDPSRSLLHFEVILPGGIEREEETEHEVATGEALGARAWTDDLWALPWRTTGNASMTGGAVPGAQAEAHIEASTPRDGITLVGLDGKVMRVW